MKRTKQLTCPTCGCPVKIGGEGTTHYYVPIIPDEAKLTRLVDAARKYRAITRDGKGLIQPLLDSADELDKALADFEEVK